MKLEDIKVGSMYRIVRGMENKCVIYESHGGTHIEITSKSNGYLRYVIHNSYGEANNCFGCFKPEHLLPMSPATFQELQVGDRVVDEDGDEYTVLVKLNDVVLLSAADNSKATGVWFHVEELEDSGFELPDTPDEEMLEIEGKKYTVSEIKEALRK